MTKPALLLAPQERPPQVSDRYFEDNDGAGEPTLWHATGLDEGLAYAILRRCDIRATDREYHWRKIVAAMGAL